jgi:gamma-glutamylcysteine synthetase
MNEQSNNLTTQQEDLIHEANIDRSYVKLIKNTKGHNWEIKVFEGVSPLVMDSLRAEALRQNNELNLELGGI